MSQFENRRCVFQFTMATNSRNELLYSYTLTLTYICSSVSYCCFCCRCCSTACCCSALICLCMLSRLFSAGRNKLTATVWVHVKSAARSHAYTTATWTTTFRIAFVLFTTDRPSSQPTSQAGRQQLGLISVWFCQWPRSVVVGGFTGRAY